MSNIVLKHTEGTTVVHGAILKEGVDNPDSRLVMGIQGGANGLVFKNNLADQMPIKIAGGKTLEQCIVEETEDYILYSDGTPVTIEQYVSGTYDLYLERLNSESEAVPMLYVEGEPVIDHAKLLNDINDAQLERLANEPMTIPDEEEYVAPILEPRTIPVPIDFCCRVDKKTGEIYIGEGYENITPSVFETPTLASETYGWVAKKIDDWNFYYDGTKATANTTFRFLVDFKTLRIADSLNCSYISNTTISGFSKPGVVFVKEHENSFRLKIMDETGLTRTSANVNIPGQDFVGSVVYFKNLQITKTSTPKPFIRTIMPSGKLSFVTGATSLSHSFVMKGFSTKTVYGKNDNWQYTYFCSGFPRESFDFSPFVVEGLDETDCIIYKKDPVYGNDFSVLKTKNGTQYNYRIAETNKGLTGGELIFAGFYDWKQHFKQLLIYKGNLTEAELKAENDKVIDLEFVDMDPLSIRHYIPNLVEFEHIAFYQPALTDEEIQEEINKNLYIPKNRDGVPNYRGEVEVL